MIHSSNGEVFGGGLLNTILIFGSVAILVASIIGPSLKGAPQPERFSDRAVIAAQQS